MIGQICDCRFKLFLFFFPVLGASGSIAFETYYVNKSLFICQMNVLQQMTQTMELATEEGFQKQLVERLVKDGPNNLRTPTRSK